MARQQRRVAIIGAGNVATHLARAISRTSQVVQVYSPTPSNAQRLANELPNAISISELSALTPDADIYLMAVSDDAIAHVAANTPDTGLWVHTSGSVPIEALSAHKSRAAVMYPLQTFSRDVEVDVSQVPFFVEGNTPEAAEAVVTLARELSQSVNMAGSEERRRLHIAAVIACNLANHLWTLSDEYLTAQGLDFSVLAPLLRTTLDKAIAVGPANAQTGPASRGDTSIVASHIKSLTPPLSQIYKLISDSIIDHRK